MNFDLGEELTLPADIIAAVQCGRPELIFDRELSIEEQTCVLNLCRVLLKKVYEQQLDIQDYQTRLEDVGVAFDAVEHCLGEAKDAIRRGRSSLNADE